MGLVRVKDGEGEVQEKGTLPPPVHTPTNCAAPAVRNSRRAEQRKGWGVHGLKGVRGPIGNYSPENTSTHLCFCCLDFC